MFFSTLTKSSKMFFFLFFYTPLDCDIFHEEKKKLYIYKFMYIQSCVCVCVCSEKGKLFFSSSFQNRREDFFFLIYPVNEKETSKTRPCVDRLHCATHYFWHPGNVTCGECVSRDIGVFFFFIHAPVPKKKKKETRNPSSSFRKTKYGTCEDWKKKSLGNFRIKATSCFLYFLRLLFLTRSSACCASRSQH